MIRDKHRILTDSTLYTFNSVNQAKRYNRLNLGGKATCGVIRNMPADIQKETIKYVSKED